MTSDDSEWDPTWQRDDWGPLERATLETISDEAGRFEFNATPGVSDEHGSVLWATHPGFRADYRFFEAGVAPQSIDSLRLDIAAPIRVKVLSREDVVVSGAVVDQFGTAPAVASHAQKLVRLRRVLHRSAHTDANGELELGAFPGVQVLIASLGQLRSVPKRTQAGSDLTLRLVPTFSVAGTVSLPSWEHLNYVGERRLTISVQEGNVSKTLLSLRHVKEGPWGPLQVPLVPGSDCFRIRLDGSPIIPEDARFAPPTPGSLLHFDLAAELGYDVWFFADNEEGEILYDAEARVWWRDKESPHEWKLVERHARADSGEIPVWSLPAGWIKYEVRAPGYVPYVNDDIELPMKPEPYTVAVTLRRAGRIRGRCLHAGRPVEDFEVAIWPHQAEHARTLHPFADREDGSFEIDESWLGEVGITASAGDLPSCVPERLFVEPDRTTEVTLELPSPIKGRGLIVDARTGVPVSGAMVQLHVRGTSQILTPWGPPRTIRPDGRFEVSGLVEGSNALSFRAEGYAALQTTARCETDASIQELGTFALQRPQNLEVRLIGNGPFSGYRFRAEGVDQVPLQSFPHEGILRVEDIAPGWYTITITEPDESEVVCAVNLVPGEPWLLEKLVGGGRRLEIEPVSDDEAELSQVAIAHIAYQSERGYFVQRGRESVRGQTPLFVFESIDADSVQVRLFDRVHEQLAVAQASFSSDELHLRVPIQQEALRLSVVDPEGNPLSNVQVTITDPSDDSLLLQGTTGELGVCTILGVPRKPIEASLFHRSAGSRQRVPCDASSGQIELVLAASAWIELQLFDQNAPATGISCSFLWKDDQTAASALSSGSDGRARFEKLTPERYRIRCWHPDYWTVDLEIEARESPEPTPVQIRRLGAVELQVLTGGIPVSGQAIDLRSSEFGASVQDWIDAGRITAPSGLSTNVRGTISLEGLPHGPYVWAIALSDGKQLQGTLTVLPGKSVHVPIGLP